MRGKGGCGKAAVCCLPLVGPEAKGCTLPGRLPATKRHGRARGAESPASSAESRKEIHPQEIGISLQLKTLLNRVHPLAGFVYRQVAMYGEGENTFIEAIVEAHAGCGRAD
jgi:hypothetical protein